MQREYSVLSSWQTPTVTCNPVGLRACQSATPVLPCSVNVQSIAIFDFDMRLFMGESGRVNSLHGIWGLSPLRLLIHLVWRSPTAPSATTTASSAAGNLANEPSSSAEGTSPRYRGES